jgi:hypothetical protein
MIGFNEGKACDAVIRVIEARQRHQRSNVRLPEKENHVAPVELVCNIGSQLFAFEHTGIEPFPGQVQMEVDSRRLFDPVRSELDFKLLVDESVELMVPVDATNLVRPSDYKAVSDILIS